MRRPNPGLRLWDWTWIPKLQLKQLSVAKMQLVEIAQAISQKSRVLLNG